MHIAFWFFLSLGFFTVSFYCVLEILRTMRMHQEELEEEAEVSNGLLRSTEANTDDEDSSSLSRTKNSANKKHGVQFRSRFFVLLLFANASRFLSIVFEIFAFNTSDSDGDEGSPTSVSFIVCRTIPALFFSSSYSLLILFVAELVLGLVKKQSANGESGGGSFLETFHQGYNVAVYGTYVSLAFCVEIGALSLSSYEVGVYILIAVCYFGLGCALCYFAPSLLRILRESPIRKFLMGRVITTIGLSAATFFFRAFLFTLGAIDQEGDIQSGRTIASVSKEADALTYLLLELVPSTLLIMALSRNSFRKIDDDRGDTRNDVSGYGATQNGNNRLF